MVWGRLGVMWGNDNQGKDTGVLGCQNSMMWHAVVFLAHRQHCSQTAPRRVWSLGKHAGGMPECCLGGNTGVGHRMFPSFERGKGDDIMAKMVTRRGEVLKHHTPSHGVWKIRESHLHQIETVSQIWTKLRKLIGTFYLGSGGTSSPLLIPMWPC